MSNKILYLASQSTSRKKLLDLAQISYKVIEQKSDECSVPVDEDFGEYVIAIAQDKMKHAVLPEKPEIKTIFVLTADTLMRTKESKKILGKPEDLSDANRMLDLLLKETVELVTGCCLERKEFVDNKWEFKAGTYWAVEAELEFKVPKEFRKKYFENEPNALYACGAGVIEGYGMNFLHTINGSFSAIMGLPLAELRKHLNYVGY